MNNLKPGLFGLKNSNRNFTNKNSWGKNQFNSSFPASLCCFLYSNKIKANYLCIENGKFTCSLIGIDEVFEIDPDHTSIFFAFEAQYSPYQKYINGNLPRTDLVIQNSVDGKCLSAFEVKLTALPDNSTFDLDEDQFGCEIVIRPDTIVYLACSLAESLKDNLKNIIPDLDIKDWGDANEVLKSYKVIHKTIEKISVNIEKEQKSFLIQPIWKTDGKSPELMGNCLDVFIWSNAGFTKFISEISIADSPNNITRQLRTTIWLFKMLYDMRNCNKFDPSEIIDSMSYNTKNDKAFASSGNVTNKFMKCERLKNPIISKSQIKQIILGNGQNLLSPERRFDSIIFNSPDLFE